MYNARTALRAFALWYGAWVLCPKPSSAFVCGRARRRLNDCAIGHVCVFVHIARSRLGMDCFVC